MKQLRMLLPLLLCAIAAEAAGSLSVSAAPVGGGGTSWMLAMPWVGDSVNGSVPTITVPLYQWQIAGYTPLAVEVTPGSPSPTSGYSLKISDPSGVDILAGAAASLSSTVPAGFAPGAAAPPLDTFTVTISGQNVAGARGTIYLFLSKPGTVIAINSGGGGGGGSPTGAAGGSLTGSYPNPGVATLNQNTSGTAGNLSGTPALPNGTTATTQTPGDNTTKLATDAFVIANAGGSPTGAAGGSLTGTYPNPGVATLNQNTSGTAGNLSGTPALPNGTAATTQPLGDNSTKLATDAFVIANAGSGGSSIVTGLTTCKLVRTSPPVLTIAASVGDPCNVRVGNTVTSYTSSATLTISAGTGTVRVGFDTSVSPPALKVYQGGLTFVASGMGVNSVAGAAFGDDDIEIATATATLGAWDTNGITDLRALPGRDRTVAGTYLASSVSAGSKTVNFDNVTFGFKLIPGLGANLASATSITLTNRVHHITGTTTINTLVTTNVADGEYADLIFDGIAPLGTSGNIKAALTPTVNTIGHCIYSLTDTKWYCTPVGGAGGATDLLTYWAPLGFPANHLSNQVVGANTPQFFEAVVPYSTTINNVAFYIGTALGSGCTGGTCGVKWSIWSKGCAAKLAESVAYTTAATAGVVVTSAISNTFTAGQYCIMLGTDSATLALSQPPENGTLLGMLNQGAPLLLGSCGNSMTGNGASLAFPATCGTKTSGVLPFNLAFTQ